MNENNNAIQAPHGASIEAIGNAKRMATSTTRHKVILKHIFWKIFDKKVPTKDGKMHPEEDFSEDEHDSFSYVEAASPEQLIKLLQLILTSHYKHNHATLDPDGKVKEDDMALFKMIQDCVDEKDEFKILPRKMFLFAFNQVVLERNQPDIDDPYADHVKLILDHFAEIAHEEGQNLFFEAMTEQPQVLSFTADIHPEETLFSFSAYFLFKYFKGLDDTVDFRSFFTRLSLNTTFESLLIFGWSVLESDDIQHEDLVELMQKFHHYFKNEHTADTKNELISILRQSLQGKDEELKQTKNELKETKNELKETKNELEETKNQITAKDEEIKKLKAELARDEKIKVFGICMHANCRNSQITCVEITKGAFKTLQTSSPKMFEETPRAPSGVQLRDDKAGFNNFKSMMKDLENPLKAYQRDMRNHYANHHEGTQYPEAHVYEKMPRGLVEKCFKEEFDEVKGTLSENGRNTIKKELDKDGCASSFRSKYGREKDIIMRMAFSDDKIQKYLKKIARHYFQFKDSSGIFVSPQFGVLDDTTNDA